MTTIRERAQAAQERAGKATAGPWEQWKEHAEVKAGPLLRNTPGVLSGGRGDIANCETDDFGDDKYEDEEIGVANAAFIAAARADVPDLASYVLRVTGPEFRERLAGDLSRVMDPHLSDKLTEEAGGVLLHHLLNAIEKALLTEQG